MRHSFGIAIVILATGCADGPVLLPRGPDQLVRGQYAEPTRPRNVIYRDELVATIAGGIPRFLQKVSQRALTHKDAQGASHFDGYLLEALRPASDWMAFDFVPGDLVTHVNGTSLGQHPSVILPFFESLASQDELTVTVVRNGETVHLSLRVVERGVAPKP